MTEHPRYNEQTGQWERTWERDPEVDRFGALRALDWYAEEAKRTVAMEFAKAANKAAPMTDLFVGAMGRAARRAGR